MSVIRDRDAATGASLGSRRAGAWLLAAVLVVGAMQSAWDVVVLHRTGHIDLLSYQGPAVFKVMKDALVVGCLALPAVLGLVAHRARVLTIESSLLLVAVALLAAVSFVANGPLVAVAGLRWFLPIALLLLLPARPPSVDPRTAARMLHAALAINVSLQVVQLFVMPPVYGQVVFGLSARTPGVFLIPNTAAFFGCVCAAAVLGLERSLRLRLLALLLGSVSVLLTQSGTGLVAMAALWLLALGGRQTIGLAVIGMAALPVLFGSLESVTGREDYLKLSGGERIRVLIDVILPVSFDLDGFGLYTNTASLLLDRARTTPEGTVIAIDSFVASFIGNFGLLALPAAVLLVRFAMRSPWLDWRALRPLLLTFLLFSFTTIVTEAFPMSVLLPLIVWASARERAQRALAPPTDR